MTLSDLGFDLPFCSAGVFYFECKVQLEKEQVTEVSFTDTINNINRLLSSIRKRAKDADKELSVISPKLVDIETGEMVPKKKYEVIYGNKS